MSAETHTPGPWLYDDDSCAECERQGTKEFVILGPPGGQHGQFTNEADARLIAAAPDLLEALKDAIGALEFSRDYHCDLGNEEQAFCQDKLDAALRAISKAQGSALAPVGGE